MSSTPLTLQTDFAVESFLLDAQARNLSPRTIRYYRQQLSWFSRHLAISDSHSLDQVTPHHIREYLVNLRDERHWKPASVQAAFRAIRAFLNFCYAEDLIGHNPVERVRPPKADLQAVPAMTAGEVRMLLDATLHQRDRAIVLCLLDTGCRASEVLAWNVEDVNIATGIVRVRHTKARKERTVFLGTKARRELIKVYATQDSRVGDPVWRTLDAGSRLTYQGLKSMLQTLARRSGVKGCNAHAFRRTFAVMALRNGMNIYALQRIMGHADLSILRHYLALVDDDLLEAHRSFGAVDHL